MPAELYALPDPVEKTCSRCKQVKLLSEYFPRKDRVGQYYGTCKPCCREIQRTRRKNNPAKVRELDKVWRLNNRNKRKNSDLKIRYGITLDQYKALAAQQRNRCAICGNESKNMALAVDHCHSSNKVRGLLCAQCNTALGGFKDNPRLLQAAITYLELRS